MVRPDNGILFHFFHVIYLGYPSTMLEQLWSILLVTKDHEDDPRWKECMNTIAESFRTTGMMAGLLSAATAALLAITQHEIPRILLFSSLASSIISASSVMSFLSVVPFTDRIGLRRMWEQHGIVFLVALSTPFAWLSCAFLTFQAALIAMAWINDENILGAILAAIFALKLLLDIFISISLRGPPDFFRHVLGLGVASRHTLIPTRAAIKRVRSYVQSQQSAMRPKAPIPQPQQSGMRRYAAPIPEHSARPPSPTLITVPDREYSYQISSTHPEPNVNRYYNQMPHMQYHYDQS